MPELPEVEVVKRGLAQHLPGRIISGVKTDGKALRHPVPEALMKLHLTGAAIVRVERRAKYLLITFDNGSLLIIHLGMTGKLGLFPADSPELLHDHVFWQFDNRMELRFNDVRRFGSVRLFLPDQTEDLDRTVFRHTGPEPFSSAFNAGYLKKRASGRSIPVKNFIMDGSVVAGVGNIYANESLFAAGLHPARPIGKIGLQNWKRLIAEIRTVLEEAIACGGSTISDFLGADGASGYFQINFKVYGRSGQDCPQCAHSIARVRLGGRASFFCPKCQK